MAGTVVADTLQAASTSTLVLKNGVASTPPTVQDSGGVEIGTFCRAWVNFNGTGTVAIRADFNVTDITDGGTGTYTVNIDNDMPDANYSINITGAASGVGNNLCTRISGTTLSASSATILFASGGGSLVDCEIGAVSFFR